MKTFDQSSAHLPTETTQHRGPSLRGDGQDEWSSITDTRGSSLTWDLLTQSPWHPPTRAGTSTHAQAPPQQMSPQQPLLLAGDVETNTGPAPRCGVCMRSTTVKAVICCTCQKSIHKSCSGMTRTIQNQWRQTNNHQCPNCRLEKNSQILCCKCG